jgi:hypothetical protein
MITSSISSGDPGAVSRAWAWAMDMAGQAGAGAAVIWAFSSSFGAAL